MIASLAARDLAIDHELAQTSESFQFILDVTPTDIQVNCEKFLCHPTREPIFTYRELEFDPGVIDARLKAIDVSTVEDATLGHLLRAKKRELKTQLEMLRARNTPGFLPLSIEQYGTAGRVLLEWAHAILDHVPVPVGGGGDRVDAVQFAELARIELAHYQLIEPDIDVHVQVRPDVTGVTVSGHELLVGSATHVLASRVHALLQHEVGTHLVTYVNGSHQPILLMAIGLAGYEETQEGLAVLAEFLVGGLSSHRLRQLAVRVVAVDRMIAGDSFAGVHRYLVDIGIGPRSAFTTTARVFRSGGFTKDIIYLRGFLSVLEHLAGGGELDLLWLGKLSLEDLPLVGELYERGTLEGPRLLPRYLADSAVAAQLERADGFADVAQLIGAFT